MQPNMNNIRFYFLAILVIFGTNSALSQNITLTKDPNFIVDPSINSTDLNQIVELLETTINEYAAAAKLLDETERRVTEGSIDRFQRLFTPSARILQDYAEFIPRDPVSFRDYALEVYNALRLQGVQVVVKSAVLKEVRSTATGFYVPVITVTKTLYNSLSSNGSINSITTGRTEVQEFTFDIFKDDLSRASISLINFDAPPEVAARYTQVIGIPIGVGSGAFSPTLSSFWDQNHSEASLEINGGINFSIGVEFLTDRFITPKGSSSRPLALSVGVRYSSYQWKTKLNDFSIEPFEQVAQATTGQQTNTYQRIVGPVAAEENLRFGVLEVPLGVAFNLIKKSTTLFYIHTRFVPGFVFSGSGDLSGAGDYDGTPLIEDPNLPSLLGTPANFRILEQQAANPGLIESDLGFGPYRVGAGQVLGSDSNQSSLSAEPELAGVTFAVQLSPTLYLNFSDDNPGWGMLLGLDLNYHFGSFMTHNPISATMDNALKYNDDFQGSLLDYYGTGVSGLSFGLRIGLFQRLNIEP